MGEKTDREIQKTHKKIVFVGNLTGKYRQG
jgi:hypothetical protein